MVASGFVIRDAGVVYEGLAGHFSRRRVNLTENRVWLTLLTLSARQI